MKLAFNNSLLGEFECQGGSLAGRSKPNYQKSVIVTIIIIIIALNVLGSIIGACTSCVSNGCNSCSNACTTCSANCSSGCSSCFSCGSGCNSSSGSSSNTASYYDTNYCTVYNNINGEAATFEQDIYKIGCKKQEGTWSGSFRTIDTSAYEFEGYYKDEAYTKRISTNDFSDGKSYYAKFVEVGYGNMITFIFTNNLPDWTGNYSIPQVTGTIGQAMPSTINYDSPDGFEFLGVFVDKRTTSAMVYDSNGNITNYYRELHTSTFGKSSGTITLYALYKAETFSVKVYDGLTNNVINTKTVDYGDSAYSVLEDYLISITNNLRKSLDRITDGNGYTVDEDDLKNIKVTSNLSFYVYVSENVLLTLDYGDSGTSELYVTKNTQYVLPIPTKEVPAGYSFEGWYLTSSYDPYDKISQIYLDSDKTVYVNWSANSYSIEYRSSVDESFLTNGTYKTSNLSQEFKDTVGNKLNPSSFGVVPGYDAVGFIIKQYSTTQVVTSIPAGVYGNLIVYVKYEPIEITVTLDTGSSNLDSKNYTPKLQYGESFVLEVPIVTAASREFLGYYYGDIQVTNANGQSLINFNESSLGISYNLLASGSVTFVARIQTKKYTVNFYDRGVLADTQVVNYGSTVSTSYVPSPATGQEFSAWSKSSQTLLQFNFNDPIYENCDLFAYFVTKQIKITLDPGSGQLANRTLNVPYGSAFTAGIPTFNDKFQFDGYFFEENGIQVTDQLGNSKFTLNESNLGISYDDLVKGIIITARKHTKTYTVKYYNLGAQLAEEIVEHGQIPNSAPSVSPALGYTFVGWSLNASGTQTIYDLSTPVTSSFNLYAVTERAKIDVLIDTNGGTLSQTSLKIEYRTTNRFAVPTYSDPQYEFVGYYYGDTKITDKNGDLVVVFQEDVFGMSYQDFLQNGVTLFARKQTKQLNVNFYEGDNVIDTQVVSYGAQVSTSVTPSNHDGYNYVGWSTSSNTNNIYDFGTAVTQNMNLYAAYEAITYTITLNTTYGTIVFDTKEVAYDSTFIVQVPDYASHPELEFVGFYYGNIQVVAANGASISQFNMSSLGLSNMSAIENGIVLEERTKTKEFTVTFITVSDSKEVIVTYGAKVSEPSAPAAQDGYFFKGWTTDSSYSSNFFDFNTEITSNLTLYAKFDNKFIVYLYDKNKTTLLTTITVTYNQEWSINYVYPSEFFAGWYDSSNNKKVTDNSNYIFDDYRVYSFTKDLVLYAYVDED